MKRLVLVLLAFVCFSSFGQDWTAGLDTPPDQREFRVGDKVSFLELHNMINYPKKTYKLSEHPAKLTILDFWMTSCGPCIKFWPTALKLKEEFGVDLQIIPVDTHEDSKRIKAFLGKREKIDGFRMSFPMSCRDSTIWKNFSFNVLPTYVWIDQNGVVGAITEGKDVTRENIRKWITSGPFKMDNLTHIKYQNLALNEPIFVNGNGGKKESDVFLSTSSITKGQRDIYVNNGIFYDTTGRYGIAIINSPIICLYGYANSHSRPVDFFDYLPWSRIQIIAKDTSKYYGDGTAWGNTYSYQYVANRPKTRKELMETMQQDLQRYFGMNAKWEKQKKRSLVFTTFDSTLATKSKSLGEELKLRDGDIIIDSVKVGNLITVMLGGTGYYRDRLYPLIDETGYNGVITGIREKSNDLDPITLDRILIKHGFRLKFEMREVDVLVLTEPETPK